MKKSTHKRLTAWLLTLALVVTLLPGMGMTALAVEDESTGPPAVTAPTDPVDPIDPVDPVDPFDPVDPVDPTDSVDPVDPIDPVDPEPPKPPEEPEPSGEPLAPPVMKAPMRAASLTAAANGIPGATSVFVDDGKSFYDGAGNQNQLYYKNGDEADKFKGTVDDYNAHYDPDTGVLTLKGYAGGRISVGGTAKADIIIELVGENIVNGSVSCDMGGDITIKGSGSLKVTNAENGNGDVCGIAAGYGNLPTGNVTIAGSANVTINAANHYNGSRLAYGIFARQSITISDSASVDITCSAPNSTASRSSCYGMYVSPSTSGGRVTIDTAGDIQIKATDAGSEAYSCGVSAPNYTLTKVGSMEVQWKDARSGGAIYGTGVFNDATHAVNVDTTNCYASYRFGTPHKVTVTGGYLTGPGVKYERNSGYFLAGDTVKLTAPTRYADSANTVEIPFDQWVSDDVTITNGSRQTASFTMPNNNVTVRANYNPFTVQPTFTRDSSYANKGTVSFTLVSGSFDSAGGPKIYRASNLEKITGDYSSVDNTQKTITVFEASCPKGEYVVGVSYNGVMCYSEPFRVKYTAPSASVAGEVTVSGSAGTTIDETSVTVTLENDTFVSSLSGEWIRNLPAGLSQSVTRTNDTTATITISGAPLVASTEDMKITIPAGALMDESSTSVTVSIGGKAKFNITSNAPTAEKIQIGDGSDNKFSADKLYYKNGENGAKGTFSDNPSGYNAKYDPATGTLTLKDYNGPHIKINGGEGQTVIVKLEGNDNTVKGDGSPAIWLVGGVNLVIDSEANAKLLLTADGDCHGIGNATASDVGSVTITGSANVTIKAIAGNGDAAAYGILSGKDVAVLGNASLTITCSSVDNAKKGYGIYASSGKVTVDTTGTVDIDVSGCANSDTYCIQASSIEFKKAAAITLKYVPKSAGWSLSKPTYGTIDASSMKTPTTVPDPVVVDQVTTVTYAKKGARPAKPTLTLSSNITTDIKNENIVVTLKHENTGVELYYTTDGTVPTKDSEKYTESFPVTKSCTVKAVAYSPEDEQYSDVVEQVLKWYRYKINKTTAGVTVCDEHGNPFTDGIEPGTKVYIKAPLTKTSTSGEEQIFDCWDKISNATIADTSANETYFTMPYQHISITAKYVAKPAGVTVSGTVTSYGSATEAVTVTLTKSGESTPAQTVTIAAPGSGSTPFAQDYSFSAVPDGKYTLKVEKKGHAPWTEEITVGSSAVTKDVTVYLYGDVNGDGKVNVADINIIRLSIVGKKTFDNYEALLANVNKDDTINVADINFIRLSILGRKELT